MRCVAMSPLAARLARPNLRFSMITGRTQSPRDWDGGALFSLVDKLIDFGILFDYPTTKRSSISKRIPP